MEEKIRKFIDLLLNLGKTEAGIILLEESGA